MITEHSLVILSASRRGRKPRAGVRATERIAFRVTAAERKALVDHARAEGKDLARLVRDAVDEYLSDFQERRLFADDE
jgi:uncharacterized protein (DUF1778 family)